MTLPHLHGPGHVDVVSGGGCELAEGGDVDGSRRPLGLRPGLVCGDGVREGTQLLVDFDTNRGRKVVLLLTAGLEKGESHENLYPVVRPPEVIPVTGVGDVTALPRGQVKLKILFLEPSISIRLETARFQEGFL